MSIVICDLISYLHTADIPIIILTAKIVSAEDRQRLNGQIVAVAEKSGINRAGFLTEVWRAVRQERAGGGQQAAGSEQRVPAVVRD